MIAGLQAPGAASKAAGHSARQDPVFRRRRRRAAAGLATPLRTWIQPGQVPRHRAGAGRTRAPRWPGVRCGADRGGGRLEAQGPPVLAARGDLGEFHPATQLASQPSGARRDPPAGQRETGDGPRTPGSLAEVLLSLQPAPPGQRRSGRLAAGPQEAAQHWRARCHGKRARLVWRGAAGKGPGHLIPRRRPTLLPAGFGGTLRGKGPGSGFLNPGPRRAAHPVTASAAFGTGDPFACKAQPVRRIASLS